MWGVLQALPSSLEIAGRITISRRKTKHPIPSVIRPSEQLRKIVGELKLKKNPDWHGTGGGRFNLPNERTDHLSLSFLLSPSRSADVPFVIGNYADGATRR